VPIVRELNELSRLAFAMRNLFSFWPFFTPIQVINNLCTKFSLIFKFLDIDNLSTKGRELLYAESVRYSKALHQLLQAKYGILPGAQKFMEAMSLLEVAGKMKTLLAAFVINLEMIYERPNKSQTFPKAIKFYPKTLVR
jgi:hypothetical protein